MKTLIDCAVDPLSLPRWTFSKQVKHREQSGVKFTDITLSMGKWLVYVSLRGHHFKSL